MNLKKTTFEILLSALIFCSFVNAQNLTQTIRGTVLDRDSKSPLAGANVIITNTDPVLGSSTDIDGKFEINNVPIGRQTIQLMYIGYKTAEVSNIMVGSGKEVVMNIELVEELISTDEVVVTAKVEKETPVNEMAVISARSFTVEETQRYAASINDPARMAMSFAGVSSGGSDAQNQIVIRGNAPYGMLWQIEGVPVTNPNHFAEEGATGGAICLISNNMLDNSDFLTGAWPAEFGNALSGVFDINFRKGNASTYEHAFEFSALGMALSSEGPIPVMEGASYLVNYRYSTLAIFDAVGLSIIDKNKGLPEFQDLSYKILLPSQKLGVFSIWGIGGLSNTKSESEIEQGLTYDNREYCYLEEEGEEASSDIGIAGITYTYFPDNRSYFKSAISFNATDIKYTEDGLFNNELQINERCDFENDEWILSSLYNRKFNARNTFRMGLTYDHLGYNTKFYKFNDVTDELEKRVDAAGSSHLIQGFIQSQYKLNDYFSILPGLHGLYFRLNDKYRIEPRLALNWDFKQGSSLTFGYSMHSQLLPLSMYLTDFEDVNGKISQVNKNLDFSKARHYAASYNQMFWSHWRIKLEVYYQDLYNIPIAKDTTDDHFSNGFLKTYSMLNQTSTLTYTQLDNKGTGKNYGVEITLEKFLNSGWYFLSTTSIYQAKYKGLDGVERNTRYNGNFSVNLLAGKEFNFGKNKIVGLNTRVIWAGGRRDNPVKSPRLLFDDNGDPVIDDITGRQVLYAPDNYDKTFFKQLGNYFRIDIGISHRINFAKTAHIISFDVQNVLNRENIRKIDEYDTEKGKYVYKTQAGIIPSFKYRIEF